MSPFFRRACLCAICAAICCLVATPHMAAAAVHAPRVVAARSSANGAIAMAVPPPQVLSAPSGLTTVRMPYQVLSGNRLVVGVRTLPRALVTLTITFADGTAVIRRKRATAAGRAIFSGRITYQPQSSAETATVLVTATLRPRGLHDSVSGAVTVRQHIVVSGRIKAPRTLVAGRTLTFTVTSNQQGADVHITLTYPDGQVEPYDSTTNARGVLVQHLPISPLHGIGPLRIDAVLSYGGVERRLAPVTVRLLRAPR